MRNLSKQTGSVIIIVLWTAVLLTVLVTAMAGKVRLSAQTAAHNRDASQDWAQLMASVNFAEMELMLERMPAPIDQQLEESEEGEILNPLHRYDGEALELNYGLPENMVVRIYDHAGKINLNRIPRRNMQLLIEKLLGGDAAEPEEVQDLLSAWTDWTDLNDLEGINGAEREFYEALDPPYLPRNNPELDSIYELHHIRGFAELFEGIDLDAAFTIYGNSRQVNLNLATREAMLLLPGLTPDLIEDLRGVRAVDTFSNRGEIGEVIPFENLTELSPWLSNETSDFYTIYVYRRPASVAQVEPNARASDRRRNAAEFDPQDYPLEVPFMNESRVGDGTVASSEANAEALAESAALLRDEDPWEVAPGIGRQAFSAVVEFTGGDSPPRVYQINPYATLPKF